MSPKFNMTLYLCPINTLMSTIPIPFALAQPSLERFLHQHAVYYTHHGEAHGEFVDQTHRHPELLSRTKGVWVTSYGLDHQRLDDARYIQISSGKSLQ